MSYQSPTNAKGSASTSQQHQEGQEQQGQLTRRDSVVAEQALEKYFQQILEGAVVINKAMKLAKKAQQVEASKMNTRLEILRNTDASDDELFTAVTEIEKECGETFTERDLFEQQLLLHLKGVEVLLGFLKRHHGDHECSDKVAAILRVISNPKSPLGPKCVESIYHGRGIPHLVNCLKKSNGKRLFLENILLALLNVLQTSQMKHEFVQNGGIEVCFEAMKSNNAYRLCRIVSIAIFDALSHDDMDGQSHRSSVFKMGIVEYLFDEFTCGNFNHIARAANLLNAIAKDSDECKEYIRRFSKPWGAVAVNSVYNMVVNMIQQGVRVDHSLVGPITTIKNSCESLIKILSKPEIGCCSRCCCCCQCCGSGNNEQPLHDAGDAVVDPATINESQTESSSWCLRLLSCFDKVSDACCDLAQKLPDITERKILQIIDQTIQEYK